MTQRIRFTAAIQAQAGKPRRLAILGYSGGIMSVSGFGPLVVDLEGMEIPPSVTVLRDHENAIAGVVGSATAKIVGGQLLFDATCANTESANDVLAILESGVQLQASIGCNPIEVEHVRGGETVKVNSRSIAADEDGFKLITKSRLAEITIVPCGADPSTSVSIAARRKKGKRPMNSLTDYKRMLKAAGSRFSDDEIDKMTEDEAKAALRKCMRADDDSEADADDDDAPDNKKADAAAIIDLMAGHCSQHTMTQAARERWTIRECKRQALTDLRASRPGAGVGFAAQGGYSRGAGEDQSAPFVAAMLCRMGYSSAAEKSFGAQALEMSRPMHRMPTMAIMSAYLSQHNVQHDAHDADSMIRASSSNISVPSLLANVLGKTLEQQWIAAAPTWRSWCVVRQAKDFKPQSAVRPSFMGTLNQLGPTGDIQHATIADANIGWQVYTFAKMLTVPRAFIINDDLSGFSEIPAAFAQMSERALSDLVYANLMSNPGSFFAIGNGNIQSGGSSALSSTSIKTAILQLRKQTGPNGSPLNMPPGTLIVPPSLEQTAKELLHSSFMFRDQLADHQGTANPWENIVNLEVEARLELGCTSPISGSTAQAGSATKWYLASTADRLPAIVGFLGTGNGPQIETAGPDFNFDNPGVSVRVLLDAGFALGDYRAMQYSAGV